MKPIVKKVITALAIKEGIDRVQEMRKPKKPSFFARLMPLGAVAAVAGVGLFVYKNKFANGSTGQIDGSPNSSGGSF
jgi:hypothetical protein